MLTLCAVLLMATLMVHVPGLRGDAPAKLQAMDFDAALAAIPVHDHDGRVALAEAALAAGKPESANRILRQVLSIEPAHANAYVRLHETAQKLPLLAESEVFRKARNLLPPRFIKTETRRFVVLSDADPHWTRTQIERIERAHHQFMRLANRLGLKPLPLEYKLVCVLFARQDDYAEFARANDNVKDSWIAGYYSPRHDWIVFYDIRSHEGVQNANAKLERMRESLASWTVRMQRAESLGQSQTAGTMRTALEHYNQHLAVERKKLDDFTSRAAIATTVHEAVHQLMFHTRIQLRTVEYPLWISEGMATSFETDSPNNAFGPDFDFAPRRTEFVRLLTEDKLIPLEQLITLTSMPNAEPDTISAVYHGSYALVTWMCRHRAVELRRYYERMQREPSGRSTPERHLQVFESIFGDVSKLERTWMRYELNKAQLVQSKLPWTRRLADDEQLVAINEPIGIEHLRLAGLQVYDWLFASATGAKVRVDADVAGTDADAASLTAAVSAIEAPGSVTISGTGRSSTK